MTTFTSLFAGLYGYVRVRSTHEVKSGLPRSPDEVVVEVERAALVEGVGRVRQRGVANLLSPSMPLTSYDPCEVLP